MTIGEGGTGVRLPSERMPDQWRSKKRKGPTRLGSISLIRVRLDEGIGFSEGGQIVPVVKHGVTRQSGSYII